MAFEKGNKLGSKSKIVDQLLKRAIAQDDKDRMRLGAEKILDACAEGERWAWEFVRDTVDGKPTQAIDVTSNDETVTESLSGFAATVAQAIAERADRMDQGMGEVGPVVPPALPPATH